MRHCADPSADSSSATASRKLSTNCSLAPCDTITLRVFEKHYTGNECAHHRDLYQYELKKGTLERGAAVLYRIKDRVGRVLESTAIGKPRA